MKTLRSLTLRMALALTVFGHALTASASPEGRAGAIVREILRTVNPGFVGPEARAWIDASIAMGGGRAVAPNRYEVELKDLSHANFVSLQLKQAITSQASDLVGSKLVFSMHRTNGLFGKSYESMTIQTLESGLVNGTFGVTDEVTGIAADFQSAVLEDLDPQAPGVR